MSVKEKLPKTRPSKTDADAPALRFYWLMYNIALETDVLELLEALKIAAYSRWDEVKGSGNSGPHQNDEVWPAVNALYAWAGPAALEPQLAEAVRKLRARYPGEGIKLIVQPCLAIY